MTHAYAFALALMKLTSIVNSVTFAKQQYLMINYHIQSVYDRHANLNKLCMQCGDSNSICSNQMYV